MFYYPLICKFNTAKLSNTAKQRGKHNIGIELYVTVKVQQRLNKCVL